MKDGNREERMRKLWNLDGDDRIRVSDSSGGRSETSYKSLKTGRDLGFSNPKGMYYTNPYYELGGLFGLSIVISDRGKNLDGMEVLLSVDDLIVLNSAIKSVLQYGVEEAPEEDKETIKELRKCSPKWMRLIGKKLENDTEFREFFTNGPPPTESYKYTFKVWKEQGSDWRRERGLPVELTWNEFVEYKLRRGR